MNSLSCMFVIFHRMLDIICNKVETESNSICVWKLKMSAVLLLLSHWTVCACARVHACTHGERGGSSGKRGIVNLVRS